VVAVESAPARGDLVWISLNPQSGHEQAGRRPALVVSPLEYNQRVGLAIVCPVTKWSKGYPFEVTLPDNLEITGVVLADQIKSLDWRAREAQIACKAPEPITAEVLGKVIALLS
jgi:mRNA interferase MazF